MGSGIDSGLIEREKRQLEKIKYRQVSKMVVESSNCNKGERNKADSRP